MAGHSKWDNIKHRKAAQDAIRSKEFMKYTKEIYVAAKNGADPSSNAALRLAIAKAKSHSVPLKNIQKAIDKTKSASNKEDDFNEYIFEGYLSNGISLIIRCLSNNHNRITSNIKSIFSKNNGSIAKKGAVLFNFNRIGLIRIQTTFSEEELLDIILEFDVEAIDKVGQEFIIKTSPQSFSNVKELLEKNGVINFLEADVTYEPNNLITLDQEKTLKFKKVLDDFKNNEDVQDIWHNMKINF